MSRRVLIVGAGASLAGLMAARLTERGIEVEFAEPPAKGENFDLSVTFDVEATQFIQRLRASEDAVPVPTFEPLWRDPKPYGKNARRALRGGRHD